MGIGYEKSKNGNLNIQIEGYCVIKIRASHKMQKKILKQRSPSWQLFEYINFVFMKTFDSLVKKASLKSFLFLGRFASYLITWIEHLIQVKMNGTNISGKEEIS